MRAKAMPGEDPMTLEAPEAVADAIVALCLPSVNENGKLYNYPSKKWQSFNAPA
jgi:hypothetical protein